jgi:lipid A 3-O-deacylase
MVLVCGQAQAHIGIHFASGKGVHQIEPYRASISWDYGPWLCKTCTWGLVPLFESSAGFWRKNQTATCDRHHLKNITVGPMFKWIRLEKNTLGLMPYAEIGIALSWFSQHEMAGRRLSTNFQFEDKIGVGARFGQHGQFDLGLRGYHYSNGSIKRPNSGVNLVMLQLGLWFNS